MPLSLFVPRRRRRSKQAASVSTWQDLELRVEVPAGATRRGVDATGKSWERRMEADYGELVGTHGADGDAVDFFRFAAQPDSELVFVVNQYRREAPETFDEHKVLLGLVAEEAARRGYEDHYPEDARPPYWIVPFTLPQLHAWLRDGDKTRPAHPPATCAPVVCPHCDGAAYPGRPGTTTLFRGSAECHACGKRFSLVGQRNERVPTVAVDLDGTLAEGGDFDPERIGEPRPHAQRLLRGLRKAGVRVIIWTVRGDRELVRSWLRKHDMPYDHINGNPAQPHDASGKVLADCYVDDRAVSADDLLEALAESLEAVATEESA